MLAYYEELIKIRIFIVNFNISDQNKGKVLQRT